MFVVHFEEDSLLKFKQVLESLDDLFTHGEFEFSPDSFTFQAMDDSLQAIVRMKLKSKGFRKYKCNKYSSKQIDLNNIAKMFELVEIDDTVIMKADDTELTVVFKRETGAKNNTLTMELIDFIGEHHGSIPEAEPYYARVTMPSAKFASICKDLSSYGDTVAISVNVEGVVKFCPGDAGATDIVLTDLVAEVKEAVSITVALNYLNSFTKATPLSDTVTICLSSEHLLTVEYKIAKMGFIRFYLRCIGDDVSEEDDDDDSEEDDDLECSGDDDSEEDDDEGTT